MLGGFLGTQQLWLSYQNSLDLHAELLAMTEGETKARRARAARKRGRRDMAKRMEGERERLVQCKEAKDEWADVVLEV